MKKIALVTFVNVASAFLLVNATLALPISGTGTLGAFTGTFDYSASSNTEATISISLTNTSPSGNSGYITGFVFNTPVNITGLSSYSFTDTDFQVLYNPNNISGSPYGLFDVGAALGGNFLGGGSPSPGIAVGSTGLFNLTFSGTGLSALTDADFFSIASIGNKSEAFVVRFRGFADGGSDKVPGAPVPEPTTMLLFGAGLIGLAGIGRRKR